MQKPWSDTRHSTAADMAICRAAIRTGSRSFYTASQLLPLRKRDPAYALYAFCRLADDAVDLGAAKDEAIEQMRERLDLIYDGRPLGVPEDRALADTVARFAIPRTLPEALLEGFEWDAENRRYADISELRAYATRVAGTVGAMMALLLGARAPHLVARACDLGCAMQLTNIARDVGEDARAGRLYLPLDWLREAGIDPDQWLAEPVHTDALGRVIARVLRVADDLYERALPGIAKLPLSCRPAIHAARLIYAEIGREVERMGLNSVANRAVVPTRRKAWLMARATAAVPLGGRSEKVSVLPEARFLVDAVVAVAMPARSAPGAIQDIPWWKLADRIVWVLHLFERLERMERTERLQLAGNSARGPGHRTGTALKQGVLP